MGSLKVWAPNAKSMQVEFTASGERVAMQSDSYGWWHYRADAIRHGTDYKFAPDDGPAYPDPRSPWQPEGVHGPSRVVDHGQFKWTDKHWQAPPLAAGLVYELHIGTFTPDGTLEGVLKKLDHLCGLGVTHIELLPVNGFAGQRGWGYDGVNLYAPHAPYGGPEGLKHFVNECHRRGMAVVLDVVYNHLGPVGNYLEMFGPYFTDRYHTPWGKAVNFDGSDSYEVRRFVCDNALMWLRDYHFDALRIDAVHAIIDPSAVHILEQLAHEVHELSGHLGRHLTLIAESDLNDPRIVQPWEIGGYGIDAQWSDDFHHALHAMMTGEKHFVFIDYGKIADLAKSLTSGFIYDGRYSVFRRRPHGRPPGQVSGQRLLGYLQNHDQVGDRALGERTSVLVSEGYQKIASALIYTAPFIPMLFQGEEWGCKTPFMFFTDFADPAMGEAVREGRRRDFADFHINLEEVPDPQAEETFNKSKLNWGDLGDVYYQQMLAWHRELIQLRRSYPCLTDGRLDKVFVDYSEEERWLVMSRGAIHAACNFSDQAQELKLAGGENKQVLLSSTDQHQLDQHHLTLPPESVVILRDSHGDQLI